MSPELPSIPSIDPTRRQVIASLAVIPGAGAAAGYQLGGVSGRFTTEVDQAVILREAVVHALRGGLGNVNVEGRTFRTTGQIYQGDLYVIHLIIDNQSDNERLHRLVLSELPTGLTVDAFADDPSEVDVKQVEEREWLVRIQPDHQAQIPDDEQVLELVIGTANTFETGFSTIEGILEPYPWGE